MDSSSNELVSMKCDYYQPGGIGDFYGIYEGFLQAEFDTCYNQLWYPMNGTPTRADFRYFIDQFGEFTIVSAKGNHYPLPIANDSGDWTFFGTDYLLQTIGEESAGMGDSIRHYEIFAQDSVTSIGQIRLSKNFGLQSFVSFRYLDDTSFYEPKIYSAVGYEVLGTSVGIQFPDVQDYFPYQPGDELLLEHIGYNQDPNNVTNWILFENYLDIDITGVNNSIGDLEISGIATSYDSLGFYIETDSNFSMKFEMLDEVLTNQVSVPFESVVPLSPHVPTPGLLLTDSRWYMKSNGIELNIVGSEADICDLAVVDGLVMNQTYDPNHGLEYHHASSIGGPPTTYKLIAYKSPQVTYGNWPTKLSVNEVEGNVDVARFYPNPATDMISLSCEDCNSALVEVYDVSGRRITTIPVNEKQLDVSILNVGVYLFTIEQAGKRSTSKVIIH